MRRHMRLHILVVTAVCSTLILSPWRPVQAQGRGETLKIQDYAGLGNMLTRVAITKGYCNAHGLTCQLQMFVNGPLGAAGVINKGIDVGFFTPDVQIAAMRNGLQMKIIAGSVTRYPFLLTVRNDMDLPDEDKGVPEILVGLLGKKIGVSARGSAPEIMFVYLAEKIGLKAEDFTFVANGSPNTAYLSLMSKQVDANMSFEPTGAMCEVLKTCRVLYHAGTDPKITEFAAATGAATNHVVLQDTLDKRSPVIEAYVEALKDAEAFIQDAANFEEALTISQSYFKLEFPRGDEVMRRAWEISAPAYKASINRASLRAISDYLVKTKQIEAPIEIARIVWEKAPQP